MKILYFEICNHRLLTFYENQLLLLFRFYLVVVTYSRITRNVWILQRRVSVIFIYS